MATRKGVNTRLLRNMTNVEVTNRGWMRYLHTVQRLASEVVFGDKSRAREARSRLKTFLANAAFLMDPEVDDMPKLLVKRIKKEYERELGIN